ncbi:MAG: glutathione S-transferase family protein [Pseudomonadota bacterium]
MQLKVHGAILSPWVRRLVATLEIKGVEHEIIPLNPMGNTDPDFKAKSPLGKIPILEVDGRFMPDSLAACAFLEKTFPTPALFPEDPWELGWMHWLCDYLATGVFSKVEAPLFFQRFIRPVFQQAEPDQTLIDEALAIMPEYFDYLERQLEGDKSFLVGRRLSLADLSAGSIFINFRHAGVEIDAAKWPALAAYVSRLHALPAFAKIIEMDRKLIGAVSPMFATA